MQDASIVDEDETCESEQKHTKNNKFLCMFCMSLSSTILESHRITQYVPKVNEFTI